MKLFPHKSIIYKQHRLIHYPTIIKRNGPLIQQCVLKYERKHSYFKKIGQVSMNFRNIMKTFMKRHQIMQFANWSDGMPLKENDIFTAGKWKPIESELFCYERLENYSNILINDKHVFSSHSFKAYGTVYSIDNCTILEMTDYLPVFGRIDKIFAGKTNPVVGLEKLHVVDYDAHSQTYLVAKDKGMYVLRCQSTFVDYHPLSLHLCYDLKCKYYHISLRNRLDFNNFACP